MTAPRPAPTIERPPPEFDVLNLVPIFGLALFGTHWQADFARDLGISKSLLSRALRGERDIPDNLAERVKNVVIARVTDALHLLDNPGMPYAGTQRMAMAMTLINEGLALLRADGATGLPTRLDRSILGTRPED